MYVRLAFAVAAHLEPEILVVDEVLAVGDLSFQRKCVGKMQNISKQGRTILFVSHDMKVITALTEKAILLNQGSVVAIGDTKAVTERYYALGNHTGCGGSVDLTTKKRAGGDRKIEFIQIELQNSNEEITASFPRLEPIMITLKFVSHIQSDEFEVGYSIKTVDGTVLFTSSTTDGGRFISIKDGEFLVQSLIQPNYLKPGTYAVQVGITCGQLRDLISEAIWFEILPKKEVEGPILSLPGYFCFPYGWKTPTPISRLG
jgi:lipopolysaccharide transport system ATP-binding protein